MSLYLWGLEGPELALLMFTAPTEALRPVFPSPICFGLEIFDEISSENRYFRGFVLFMAVQSRYHRAILHEA